MKAKKARVVLFFVLGVLTVPILWLVLFVYFEVRNYLRGR